MGRVSALSKLECWLSDSKAVKEGMSGNFEEPNGGGQRVVARVGGHACDLGFCKLGCGF